ncbi:MAG: hypothetical protein V4472_25975 [Pseudomonadota bacterium]
MTGISVFRLNLLRAGYLLIAVGLGLTLWPEILDPASHWGLSRGVVVAMLGALSALSVLGLRYPLRMLPLLLFELAWKALWLSRVALPLWLGHRVDAGTAETIFACALVIVLLPVIPWRHVVATYVTAPGEPWRRQGAPG